VLTSSTASSASLRFNLEYDFFPFSSSPPPPLTSYLFSSSLFSSSLSALHPPSDYSPLLRVSSTSASLHAHSPSRVPCRSFFEVGGLPTREELLQPAGSQAVRPPCRGSSPRASSSTLPASRAASSALIRSPWIWPTSPTSGKVGLSVFLALPAHESLTRARSLHHHQAAAPRPHRRTPRELLVAHMGQPEARAERGHRRQPVRDHLQRRELRAAARSAQPRRGDDALGKCSPAEELPC
jgi:hypothetical protein